MRTEKQNPKKAIKGMLFTLPVIAIAFLTFSSCGNAGNREVNYNTVAPPPPPPPPPVSPVTDSVYLNVDELPVFSGGDTALLHWVVKHTKYPDEAKRNNITGKVLVKFIVGKDGTVSKPEIIECSNPLFESEALRVTGSLPKFEKPAIVNGKPVAVHFMLPISFRLN